MDFLVDLHNSAQYDQMGIEFSEVRVFTAWITWTS